MEIVDELALPPAAPAEEAPMGDSKIQDVEGLYKYSGLLDDLRDMAKFLCETGNASPGTVQGMVGQYEGLKNELAHVVTEDQAGELLHWAPALDATTATISDVAWASSQLSRWADLMYQASDFMLNQKVRTIQHQEVSSKVTEAMRGVHIQAQQEADEDLKGYTQSTGLYL